MDHTEAQHLIPTNRGPKSEAEIVSVLMFSSYAAQRDDGMPAVNAQRLLGVPQAYEVQYQRQCRLDELEMAKRGFLAKAIWCSDARSHARTAADCEALRTSERAFRVMAKAARRKAARVVRIGGAA